MIKKHSTFNSPRRELIGFVQKGVLALLILLCISSVGLYKFTEYKEELVAQKLAEFSTLQTYNHALERYWFEWLLYNDSSKNHAVADQYTPKILYSKLLETYTKIDQQVSQYALSKSSVLLVGVKDELAFLNTLSPDNINNLVLSPEQVRKVRLFIDKVKEQSRRLAEQEVILNYHSGSILNAEVWLPFAIFACIALVLVVWAVLLVNHVTKGFHHLHLVIERHKQGGFTPDAHYKIVDEFTDIGRLIDNELSSKEFDVTELTADLNLVELGLSNVDAAFLIANQYGDVKWLSKGFSELWEAHAEQFESLFNIDPGIDGPLGEQLPESILSGEQDIKLTLFGSRYGLVVEPIKDEFDEAAAFYLALTPLSQMAELEVLRSSLELMANGTWQYPVRVLRDDSPFKHFAVLLESIRLDIKEIIDVSGELEMDKNQPNITKLQQIKSTLVNKINDNDESRNAVVPAQNVALESTVNELDQMSYLSQQISDTVLVGYELLMQRLALVEKDVSGYALLLEDLERYLNDVRAAVLSSLSLAEGESEAIRHRFSVDLEHDISSVQQQIASVQTGVSETLSLFKADNSVGISRLERAKTVIDDMNALISGLLEHVKTGCFVQDDQIVALPKSVSELEEF